MLQFDSCSANIGSWDPHKKTLNTCAHPSSLKLMQKSASALVRVSVPFLSPLSSPPSNPVMHLEI
jgi:hypothetical protein